MPNRKFLRSTHQVTVKINGRMVDLYGARIVYRCAVCLGDLRIVNSGLKCKADETHRGFVHRDEVARLQEQQAKNLETLNQFYDIVDGKVIIRCQSQD
jgi:hypothetical protein